VILNLLGVRFGATLAADLDIVRARSLYLNLVTCLALTASGLMIGSIAAAVLMRVLSTLLFGVTATDPLTYATASIVLLLFGLGAILLPAWRATRVDPVHAIRHD